MLNPWAKMKFAHLFKKPQGDWTPTLHERIVARFNRNGNIYDCIVRGIGAGMVLAEYSTHSWNSPMKIRKYAKIEDTRPYAWL